MPAAGAQATSNDLSPPKLARELQSFPRRKHWTPTAARYFTPCPNILAFYDNQEDNEIVTIGNNADKLYVNGEFSVLKMGGDHGAAR
jgi:hypothetical protein